VSTFTVIQHIYVHVHTNVHTCVHIQAYPLLDMVDAIETHEHLNDVLAKFTSLGIRFILCLWCMYAYVMYHTHVCYVCTSCTHISCITRMYVADVHPVRIHHVSRACMLCMYIHGNTMLTTCMLHMHTHWDGILNNVYYICTSFPTYQLSAPLQRICQCIHVSCTSVLLYI